MQPGIAACLVGAVLLRLLVATSPYSGAGTPPKYGDYEAQRHWMELTTNLPMQQWYQDGPDNDPKYWPLDYPPLSGYQSYLHGILVGWFDPTAVALRVSRGYETAWSKQLMRWTVLLSDLAVFFPAAIAAAAVFSSSAATSRAGSKAGRGHTATNTDNSQQRQRQLFILAAMLLQPGLVLTDHGHFQYNCISLGLAALAAVAVAQRREVLGSVLFSLSLNHKQMSLFYAPAFFAHLLGRCLQREGVLAKVLAVARLGLAVSATFVVAWSPWLYSAEAAGQVVRRIFPVGRGLYEDYLANWWCTTSLLVKWRALFPGGALMPVCAGLTLAAAAPSMAQQIAAPSRHGLLLGMANSAAAFFMFSFQVHEKSILLPLLPISMLAASEPDLATWAPLVGVFQMFPLLVRDGVAPAYAGTVAAYLLLLPALLPQGTPAPTLGGGSSSSSNSSSGSSTRCARACAVAALAGGVLLHVARAAVPAPARYPWLWDRVFASYAFVFVAAGMAYLNWRQWHQPAAAGTGAGKKDD